MSSKNDRNPNALTHEDLYQLWTQQCEEHELQHGNCTKVFTNSAGRTKNMEIRSSNQGAVSRTGRLLRRMDQTPRQSELLSTSEI